MRSYGPELPKGKPLAQLIDAHVLRMEVPLRRRITRWLLAHYYSQGYRRFDVVNPTLGHVASYELDKDGRIPLQVQEMLSIMSRVVGQLTALDVRPDVNRQGNSISAIRDRAVGQILMDSGIDEQQLESKKPLLAEIVAMLGCAALHMGCIDDDTVGLTLDPEVVHPSEILPFPSISFDKTKVTGIIRQRYVPMKWLQKTLGKKSLPKEDMDWCRKQIGEDVNVADDGTLSPLPITSRSEPLGPSDKEYYEAVRIRELWVEGPRMTCRRYCITSGEASLLDEDFGGRERYTPIHKIGFMPNGSFWDAGLFDLLLTVAREFEKCVSHLVNTTYDLDEFPVLVMPSGQLNERKMFTRGDRNLKVLTASLEARYSGGSDFRPMVIEPPSRGDQAGRTAAFLSGILDKQNPVPDLIRQKGRGDSLPFMQFLDEEAKKSTGYCTQSITAAFGAAYKYGLCAMTQKVAESPRPISVRNVTLGLAGAVIDWNANQITFTQNPIPDVSRLTFGTMETSPRSSAIRKREVVEMFQLHQDWERFVLTALEEGLDFGMWVNDYQAAYETVRMDLLTLYGDGQRSGQVVISPHTTNPEFMLKVANGFLASPIVRAASVTVQNNLIKYRKALMAYIGSILPEPVADPYDTALARAADMARMGGRPQPQLA